MAEQRPFKPFVESSSLSALIRDPQLLKVVLLSVPTGGMVFDPLRAHTKILRGEDFLIGLICTRKMNAEISAFILKRP